MPQPTPYNRGYSFTAFQAGNPSTPLPAVHVDAELDHIATTLGGVLGNLQLIQRDDGKLKDGCVTIDAVSAELLAAITPSDGVDGEDGVSPPAPNFTMAAHTVAPGGAATVSVSGTYPNLNVDFGLPRGDPAAPGEATLPDADYGDVRISASGTHMKVETVLDGQVPATAADVAGKVSTGAPVTVSGSTLVSGGSGVPVGFSHSRNGQVGYHFYNGGGVTEWLSYQPAHASGDDYRIASLVAGIITDLLKISNVGIVTIAGSDAALGLTDRDGGGTALLYNLNDKFRVWFGGDKFTVDSAGNGVFAGNITSGGVAVSLAGHSHVIGDVLGLQSALDAKQPSGSYALSSALGAKADAITTILDFAIDAVLVDGHNERYLRFTGGTPRTLTFGSLTAGVALIVVNRATVNLTISCPGGYHKNGAAATATTNLTLAPGGKLTAFHEGSGVWTFDGTGF